MCAFAWLSEACSRFFYSRRFHPWLHLLVHDCITVRERRFARHGPPIFARAGAGPRAPPRAHVRRQQAALLVLLRPDSRRRDVRENRIHSGMSCGRARGTPAQDQALTRDDFHQIRHSSLNNTADALYAWVPPSPRVRCRCALARLACFTYLLAALAAGAAAAAGRS